MKRRYYIYCITALTYLLGIHRGYVALLRQDSPQPVRIYPYQARLLPPADRQALEQGIPIRTDEELNRYLEDYLS